MNEQDSMRVADAPSGNWVYKILPKAVWPYAQLARWDRPIGWWLLLWPCWWSLALAIGAVARTYFPEVAAQGSYTARYILSDMAFGLVGYFALFLIGAIAMRGAGCTYNDLVDKDIDGSVVRTASRPIPSGRVTTRQAKLFLLMQLVVGALVLYQFNWPTIFLGILSLAVVAIYPFMKRITDWPQLFLGLAFSWGALVGWSSLFGSVSGAALLLYVGCILWTIGYDTIYAHQDKEDDALVGVRSTARLFGEKTKAALAILYSLALLFFAAACFAAQAAWPAYMGLFIGAGHMIWQIRVLNIDDPDQCLKLFKSNTIFGWIIFAGLIAAIFIHM